MFEGLSPKTNPTKRHQPIPGPLMAGYRKMPPQIILLTADHNVERYLLYIVLLTIRCSHQYLEYIDTQLLPNTYMAISKSKFFFQQNNRLVIAKNLIMYNY